MFLSSVFGEVNLSEAIEMKRKQLLDCIQTYGLNHKKTIGISTDLDELILTHQRINFQSSMSNKSNHSVSHREKYYAEE
ncbi:aspartyl-phosphate phosphatase Spo0E family protein [Bacillus massilinigeriensis]|uniref:aspartyl-phosphate phosphatase Spo0E family protein n=1 Tax=Bacillus mediterraneensis TaxID=1805474 RepID=UPI0008F83303|nr:aspartyl-phosphate phosphatase Spo0E family protein [Bacillus mediterraneensis]